MHLDEKEVRGGWMWLTFAGGLAIGLSAMLYYVDNHLTFSDAEVQRGNKLRELRSAQAVVSPGVSDLRQISPSTVASKSSDIKAALDVDSLEEESAEVDN